MAKKIRFSPGDVIYVTKLLNEWAIDIGDTCEGLRIGEELVAQSASFKEGGNSLVTVFRKSNQRFYKALTGFITDFCGKTSPTKVMTSVPMTYVAKVISTPKIQIVKLHHLGTLDVANSGIFENVKNFDDLNDAIHRWGLDGGVAGSEIYNDRVGLAWEIVTEYFCARYANRDVHLNIAEVLHTSQNKYERGLDFYVKLMVSGNRGLVQSKWRANPMNRFKRGELASLNDVADELDIEKLTGRIMFYNQNTHEELLDESNRKRIRVIGRQSIESFTQRDPTFWTDLLPSVLDSAKPPIIGQSPKMRQYQLEVFEGIMQVMQ